MLDRLRGRRMVVLATGASQLATTRCSTGGPGCATGSATTGAVLVLDAGWATARDSWAEADARRAPVPGRSAGRGAARNSSGARALRPWSGLLAASDRPRAGAADPKPRRGASWPRSNVSLRARGAGDRAQRDAEARGRERRLDEQLAAQADTMRERDPQTALRLSLAAYRTPTRRHPLQPLRRYLSRPQVDLRGDVRQPVVDLAYGPGGRVLATSQRTGVVRLWDLGGRTRRCAARLWSACTAPRPSPSPRAPRCSPR
ncbi:hypothetical protein GCM10023238_35840 [Streptomyces heliomycini]